MKEKIITTKQDEIFSKESIVEQNIFINRKIKSLIVIHGHVAPGILKPNDNISDASHKDVQMFLNDGFIEVIYKGESVGVPFANIKGWVFEEA